ncbi:coiled-coil domain-containing protein 167 [Columba livia]|uniref:coiled-coil domain-containing protein 167 n=1 Tax=Columba livia TaxID=8932 RepID=UPI0031BBC335
MVAAARTWRWRRAAAYACAAACGPGTMGRRRERLSVAREIDGLEEKLAHCRQSMEEVDVKLRREKLSPEGRKSLERERNLLMTKADNYEKELNALRKENRRNAALAVAMGLLIALIYICWTM